MAGRGYAWMAAQHTPSQTCLSVCPSVSHCSVRHVCALVDCRLPSNRCARRGLVWVLGQAPPPPPPDAQTDPWSVQPSLLDPAVAVSRRAGLLTAPEPHGGTHRTEIPPCLYVWRARCCGAFGSGGGAASRSQSAPHMHVLGCICSNVQQFQQDQSYDTCVLPYNCLHQSGGSGGRGGWFVAWCSRRRQGGSGRLMLSPPSSRSTDMPLATPRLPGARGRLSLALDLGPPALLDYMGTGGAAHGWGASHDALAVRWEGPRGTLSAALPRACSGCSPERRCYCETHVG